MKKLTFSLLCLFISFLCFSQNNEKQFYLKGNSEDGLEIRIKMLPETTLDYDLYPTLEDFLNYTSNAYSKPPIDIAIMDIACSDNFPVEIINRSKKSVTFNSYTDSLTFILNGLQVDYPIKTTEYPQKIFPNAKYNFTIESSYTENDFLTDFMKMKMGTNPLPQSNNFLLSYIVNMYAMCIDYSKKDLTNKRNFSEEDSNNAILTLSQKLFYAVYSIGLDGEEIYLYATYE